MNTEETPGRPEAEAEARLRARGGEAAGPSAHPWRGRRVRVDPGSGGPGADPDQAPGRGSLLRAFHVLARGAAPAPAAVQEPERRNEPRYAHAECLAWVGWRTWRGFRMNDALVINLSRGGARVFLDAPPPARRKVWVFLEVPGQRAVIRAHPRGVERARSGQCAVRVAFDEPCPFALFEAAVCGLPPADPRARLGRVPRLGVGLRSLVPANRGRRSVPGRPAE